MEGDEKLKNSLTGVLIHVKINTLEGGTPSSSAAALIMEMRAAKVDSG